MPDFSLTQTGVEIQDILDNAETLGAQEIAIGDGAGATSQGLLSVAIGNGAGSNSQGGRSTAIGNGSGEFTQGARSVSIGEDSGNSNQGDVCVAVGNLAGSINQPDNSIVISADNVDVTPSAIGEVLIHTTVTDILSNATELKHNNIIIAGSALKVGTLASPPAGMVINEHWLDTTDSAIHPIERVSKVIT